MACFDQDTHIYVWVDTSGSVNEAAIQVAIEQLKTRLQTVVYGDVDVNTRVFYDASWTDERWVTKLTQTATAAAKSIALVFINESAPAYHANSGVSPEPTTLFLADHAALLPAVAGAERFHALLYAVTLDSPSYDLFKQHIGRALTGTSGYPSELASLSVSARLDVDPTQPADAYYRDILSFLDNLCDEVPALDAPVTVRFSESLNGVFADPTVEASFFQMVDIPVGGRYALGDQLSGEAWYAFDVRDRSRSRGLVTYAGETLISRLSRLTPRESLILVAGEGGVPAQLDLRECLRRFLEFYGVPFVDDLPQFYLRAGDEIVEPLVDAFVIQPDQENPESIYALLERFFGPFRGYTFRPDTNDRLVVTPPAWLDTIGLKLTVYRRRPQGGFGEMRSQADAPWSTARRPLVEWQGSVNGVAYSGALTVPLERGAVSQEAQLGPVTVRLGWNTQDRVYAEVWPQPSPIVLRGDMFTVTFTFRPEALADGDEALLLTNADLGPDEVESTSAESVINQAIVPVRRRTFQADQQVMQAGALVLRSPGGVMAGAFGANQPFGPLAEELETPSGFLELVNDTVEAGTWFWPAEAGVVSQPGGDITVAYEVEEWAEQWRDASAPHAPAAQVNSFGDTITLPANGSEVKLFDFQFPRQTSNFAPGPYGARGSVYGRWRAGSEPGIELRVANSRFAEFGYLAELGPFGQTVYFLWGAVVKLNGTGTTFTIGELETYRFGFSRGDDGRWESGANLPALAESQALYPDRVYTAPELPYEVSPATALAIARGIVEENLTPKAVYSLPLAPGRGDGWAARPHHLGRAVRVQAPGLNLSGRVVSIEYDEAHTPLGASSSVSIEVEVAQAPAGSRAASRAFGRMAYGVSHYQQED